MAVYLRFGGQWFEAEPQGEGFNINAEMLGELRISCYQRPWLFESLHPLGDFLLGKSRNDYSQFGEDGLIEAALERFGAVNRWCFEVGAGDGETLSNTKRLRNLGWQAVLIEAEESRCREGIVHCRIGPDDLDRILTEQGAPSDLDFGCIDVDGQDWHIFYGLLKHRPRLLMVEYCLQDNGIPSLGGEGQAGLTAMLALGREKRYVPLARTNVNILYAAKGLA